MTERKLQRNRRGFTLTEVLLALAILIILLALAMIPISRHQRNIRQTELDSKAETIYLAAQNRLSQLQASGRSDEYGKDRATALNNIPWDAEQDKYTTSTLYYVTSAAKSTDTSAAGSILPREQVEAELWDANWVIEYDPGSGSVYAVFYSEKPMQYSFDAFNPLRSRDRRVQEGATVGYYGGDSVQSEDTGKLTPKMEIINKERLLLKVTCDTPRDPLHFYVTVTDAQGHSTGRMELTGSEVNVSYRTYTVTMVLDDLTEGKRFSQQRRFRQLTPGSDLTLKVEVESDSRLVDSVTGKLTTNSLFAEVRDGGTTAVVTYARHLQNLDEGSGLPTAITRALQEQDIQFVNTGMDDGWDSCYPGRRFTPIYNENLAYYDSTVAVGTQSYHPVVYELPVDTDGDGGLFESFRGTLRNIRLCGAQISVGGNAGGLAGSLRGGTTIEGCQVYLSPTRDKLSSKSEQDIWISGATAGGLVGRCDYDLTVRNSFASSVLEGGRYAGGLVGYISGTRTVYVEHSYADCYLYASGTTGGLIGSCIGTADITLRDCYTAGFQEADVMAGLVGGELSYGDVIDTCYSASARLNGSEKLTYSTGKPADVTTGKPDITSTYYMSHGDHDMDGTVFADYEQWSGRNRADAIEKYLNDAFTAETGGSDTVAYNLVDGMGLGAYSYPRLMGLTHYGDWQAQFEAGTLVYYEVYSDGSYGFRGANKSTVKTTGTVVGDGYGMVYSTLPEQDLTVRYSLGGREVTSTLYRANAIDMGGGYYLLPLPRTLVNTTEVSTDFYRRVQVEDTTYYFNPHFTCWVSEGSEAPEAPSEIGIRTARQLNNLSLYYEQYSPLLAKDTTLQQERSIDYSGYDWANYGRSGAAVTSQQPIGSSAVVPFTHIYDGGTYPIAAVPLQSPNGGDYAGLFGLNQGSLRNVVLTTGEQDYSVTLRGILRLRTAYVGALAGRNDGTIYNCAAAGYSVTAHAYQGSVLYMGGFVGYNAGTIRSGSVSTPSLTASSNYARLLMGGFTGGNSGLVSQSYAMANVEVLQIRGGGVALSGFAGENIGSIRSSYCATALTSPGADTYGFAPATGSTSGCCYLSGGTYRFVGQVHLYDYSDQSGARAVNEQGLKALTLTGFSSADASHTYHHSKTLNTDGQAYPYPTSLTGHGSPVHYGDWVTPADLGTLGMVYWEHEEGGSNPGYHFSYIGFENGVRKDGSSLCTAHDDGGKITAYGYGYYWSKGETEPLLETQRIALDGRNTEAAAELEKQMPLFSFVTYQTSDTGLRLLSGTTGNGHWFLSQGDVWFTYTVSPFFADSYAVTAVSTGITGGTTGVEPGTDALPYQVRSVEQLQYINWSYYDDQGSSTRDVTGSGSMYKYYPYLQYTRVTWGYQSKEDAIAGDSTGGTITIGEETLKERVPVGSSNNVFADGSSAVQVKMNSGGVPGPDTYVYIGGMGGSGFSASFTNFVNRSDSSDGQPTFNNCYTYMEFPDMEGTITGISLMGSIADRAGASTNAKLYINNCYYLNSSKNSISFDNLPKYYGKGNSRNNSLSGLLRTEAAREKMLNGDLSYLRNYGWNGGSNTYSIKGLTGLTYEQMSQRTGASIVTQNNGTGTAQRYDSFAAALGNSFAWVTTEENGAEVHGKYSFPGSDEALQGQDFPFPTVLVQDNVFGRARLHYGWWPSSGLYWSKGLLTLDMITDYDAAGGESAVTLDLRFEGTDPGTELPTLSYTKDGIVTAELQPDGTGHYKVRIVGQAIGSTEIIATLGDYTARLAVDVTAKLSISVDQLSVEQYVGESTTLTLTARDGTGQVLTGVKWDVVSGSDRVVTLSPVSRDQQVTVTGKGEGEETLLVQAGVTVGQRTFTSELRLTATIHMQGVLGIAHVGDGDAVYRQGILNRDATDWDTPLGPAEGDVPDHEGLYLYSRGKAADFRYFTVTALTVLDSTGTSHDMLSTADEDYRVTVGDVVAAQQDGDFSYRPITIHGRQQETVTLQVTLTDTRTGRPYTLDIPYPLTAEDTQITATFVVGRLRLEKAVPFGQPAAGFLPTEEELASALRPVVGWTPSPDLPLFQDTTFEPIYQDTEEPGLLRWRWSR